MASDQADAQIETETEAKTETRAGQAAAELDPKTLDPAVEALLFSTDKPLAAKVIADAVRDGLQAPGEVPTDHIDQAVTRLNTVYSKTARAFSIEPVAGGYRVMTRPEHAGLLAAFHRTRSSAKLSRSAIETLAVVAYEQPITRAKLEAVRGVACGEVLKTLLERGLVAITGRAETLGRPMLYGTTKKFLDVFGLASVKDLPARPGSGSGPGLLSLDAASDDPAPADADGEPGDSAERTE